MRQRKKDRHLPACVYLKHGAYWIVKKGKWRKLGHDLHTALQEHARIISVPENGVPALIDKAMPAIIEGKSESTKKQYANSAELLKVALAEHRPDQLKHADIVQIMDGFSDKRAIANRMLTVLRLVYKWALNRRIVEHDPTVSVDRYKQTPRDRLITPQEYRAIYAHCPDWLQVVMDLCYLTGQRIGDVLKMERGHLQEKGIFVEQEKTGKRLIVGWTPDLEAVIERAKTLPSSVASVRYIIATRAGKPRAHTNVWRAFKAAAEKAGVENVTLHDLRAMSGTEAERQGMDPTALLGHTDRRTTQIYLRDRSAKVVSGPSKKAG